MPKIVPEIIKRIGKDISMKDSIIYSRRIFFISFISAVIFLTLFGCTQNTPSGGNQNDSSTEDDNNGSNDNNDEVWIPMVNLQVTEDTSVEAFDTIMAELKSRGIHATVIVDEFISSGSCESLQDADWEGHEIMAYGRPDEPDDEIVALEMLSYEEQEKVIVDAKSAIENCLGKSIKGFRSYHFSQNEDTYAILDALGIEYDLSFVANTYRSLPGHEYDVFPYRGADYNFWAVPMHSVVTNSGRSAFCDMPFRTLPTADWEALLWSEFTNMVSQKRPLLVEIHPYFSAVDPGRFDALKNFLDYALKQKAEFITIEELVAWSEQDGQ
jgi:peptidoglycan/xylan/chitin deacetylase (PgdA/CDA1 family)